MTLWPVCFFACTMRLMSTQETLILLSRAAVKDQCHDSVTDIILVTAARGYQLCLWNSPLLYSSKRNGECGYPFPAQDTFPTLPIS